jgi:tripartite-type tricarboxylate transporter receptor subunit TctC
MSEPIETPRNTPKSKHWHRLLPVMLIAALAATAASARIPFPAQSIVIVVPAPRGGGTDLFARHLARLVEDDLGQRIIVDNQPRDGGMAGVAHVTRSASDGYTLGFVWNSPLTVAPLFAESQPYSPQSYRAVMSIGFSSYVLCARKDFPADDAAQMIDVLRASPGSYSYGNDGATGTMRLAAERIFRSAGVELQGIAFSGATETARNFIAGHVDLYGGSLAAILPHVESGAAKCLLLTSADENTAVPGASGLRALGFEDEETVLWWGLIAPASVPNDVVARLESAFLRAAEDPAFRDDMARRGAVWRLRGADETDAMIRTETEAFRAIAATD